MARRRLRPAEVARFDDAAGWGTARIDGHGEAYFHCTAIAGGTRTIAPGTRVLVDLAPGPTGALEAVAVEPVAVGAPDPA